jgi:integrase
MTDLFREILDHDASATWRTSKTANQSLNMIHKFLRCSGLLDAPSLEVFHDTRSKLTTESIQELCRAFTDRFCVTGASARRYVCVMNHIFCNVWSMLPKKISVPMRKRKIVTLSEMEDRLSQSTRAGNSVSGDRDDRGDYFNNEEVKKITDAASRGPNRVRDTLLVSLLETTGLRRMGVLNILIRDVADTGDDSGRWVALTSGKTLTKGAKYQPFKIHGVTRIRLEEWLNTPEEEGGRPRGPSPFLFPSATMDNGQMSTSTLTKIFKDICTRAGFEGDPRAHLHAMRHTYAHMLKAKGNNVKQISVSLGHASVQVTDSVYLRDTFDQGVAGLVIPEHWKSFSSNEAVGAGTSAITRPEIKSDDVTSSGSTIQKQEKRPSTRDLLHRALLVFEDAKKEN